MKRIAILTYPNAALFELGCATELFALARPDIQNWYQADVVTFSDEPLNGIAGLTLQAPVIKDLDEFDMLVVPSWPTTPAGSSALLNRQMITAIKRFADAGHRVLSFCSGAFLLGELNLLNQRPATTHWRYEATFKQRFPFTQYVDDVLYLYDGLIGCSAGSAAAIDLGIEVIRQDYGYVVANQVARRLVLPPHRQGGQSQFVETPVLPKANGFAETVDWAIEHLGTEITVESLAAKASMSRRTFDRQFRKAFNMAPKEWLIAQRLHLAKQLLSSTRRPIEEVATLAGFNNATTLRHHFRSIYHISPRQFRDQYSLAQDAT